MAQNNQSLLGHFALDGFRTQQYGDHELCLYYKEKEIGIYNQTKATAKRLQAACRNFMKRLAAEGV